MVWTPPITWVDDVVYDEDDLNEQLRDNMLIIKLARTDAGKIVALTSAYFASLDGSNLTNVAKPGTANVFTAKNVFSGAGRIVLPVGVDAGLDGGPGSRWVEGDYLHHVDEGGDEWRYLGTLVVAGSPGIEGSYWIEGNDEHYVDEDGDERRTIGTSSGGHNDAAAVGGSLWIEGDYSHWIRQSGSVEFIGHADTHSDSSHTDSHSDTAHTDTHNDNAHNDNHSDVAHVDSAHNDNHGDHTDFGHADSHGDTAHSDTAHADSHNDNSHGDSHSDVAHVDSHTDAGHSDSHGDAPELVP